MSNSVTSFGESSNLCILASSYLVVIWSYPCEDIELVVISITSSSPSKTDFPFISYCVLILEVLPVCILEIGKTFHYLVLTHVRI